MENRDTMQGYLIWHDKDKPIPNTPCFIVGYGKFSDEENMLGIGYYEGGRADVWYSEIFGEQIHPFDVKKWAYVPLRILNYLNPTCGCYTLDYGEPRCMGTKEIDLCSCGGNRSLCDFY